MASAGPLSRPLHAAGVSGCHALEIGGRAGAMAAGRALVDARPQLPAGAGAFRRCEAWPEAAAHIQPAARRLPFKPGPAPPPAACRCWLTIGAAARCLSCMRSVAVGVGRPLQRWDKLPGCHAAWQAAGQQPPSPTATLTACRRALHVLCSHSVSLSLPAAQPPLSPRKAGVPQSPVSPKPVLPLKLPPVRRTRSVATWLL